MVESVLLAPHSDDESLFASIILQRYRPLVLVVTDSFRQYATNGITAHERRAESKAAARVLGVELQFLGVEDSRLNDYRHALKDIVKSLFNPKLIFAPAMQGGHADHDLVSWIACGIDCPRIIFYSTYGNPWPVKNFVNLVPTKEEYSLKVDALRCYPSQYNIMPYFVEANQRPEERLSELP